MARNQEVAELFAENLKHCRRLANLSQEELAYRASIHRTEISMLERGLREPRLGTVVKLITCLEARPEKLIGNITWLPGSVQVGSFQAKERANGH
ncbi:MAG TPA: helix-turn-helix transcriptional regulator [Solirubrobacterales bacterium]|nr:helix-turn-helix transcriptional regulator [Solirubrobacterales bacterium]